MLFGGTGFCAQQYPQIFNLFLVFEFISFERIFGYFYLLFKVDHERLVLPDKCHLVLQSFELSWLQFKDSVLFCFKYRSIPLPLLGNVLQLFVG